MSDELVKRLTRTDYADREETAREMITALNKMRNDLREMQVLLVALDAALDQRLREALGLSFQGKLK